MFELIVMIFLAVLFLVLGIFIWKKEEINLIYSYHYTKVSEDDKKKYTEEMGKSLILISIGLAITGLVDFIGDTSYGWIFFLIFLLLGFIKMSKAQKKHNKGWF